MQQFGDTTHKLWATEFGWGTVDGIGRPIPPDAPYFAYVTADQQGTYIVRAYQMAQSWDYMGPMFLWNLNIAIFPGSDDNQSGYSIITHNEVKRPAYIKLSEAAKYGSPGS